MPCYDSRSDQSYSPEYIDKLTRMLSGCCMQLPRAQLGPELEAWWDEHKEADRRYPAADMRRALREEG